MDTFVHIHHAFSVVCMSAEESLFFFFVRVCAACIPVPSSLKKGCEPERKQQQKKDQKRVTDGKGGINLK